MSATLFPHPADASASVLSIVGPQDFEEDVRVGAVVGELQEAGETAHAKLGRRREKVLFVI